MGSISQELRQAVLQAAIQGKLTKQLPSDGNARELFVKIKEKKEQLIKEKKVLFKKSTIPFYSDEELEELNIPNSWVFTQLSDVSLIQEGAGIRKWQYREKGTQLLCVTNILDGAVDLGKKYLCISIEEYNNKYVHLTPQIGDIVCSCSGGSWGKSAIYDKTDIVMLNTSTLRLRFFGDLSDNVYLYFITKSEWFKKQLREQLSGMQPNFGYAHYSRIIIPLPPLAEQHRIVTRVKELMSKIDELEKVENELCLLHQAFPDDMKASLLQAAMQGKLTEQLPSDGNAKDLLVQIKSEKERLIKEKKIKKEKAIEPISEDDVPFDIPKNWVWCRLGEACETNIGLTYKLTDIVKEGTLVLRSSNIQNGRMVYDDNVFVNCNIPSSSMINKGDVLICVRNGSRKLVGKSAIVDKDGMAFGAFMAKVHSSYIDTKFIQLYIESHVFRGELDNVGTETINQITQQMLKNSIFPLPPLAEQKRIVEKLDKLLPLCDSLQNGLY